MRISLLLDLAKDAFGDRIAFGAHSQPLTYAELSAKAAAAAAALSKHAARQIVFVGLNGDALPITFFASAMMGLPFSSLNYRLPDEDLQQLVHRCAPAVVIIDDDMAARLGDCPGAVILARSEFEAVTMHAATEGRAETGTEDDIAVVLFTSGTAGAPKAAILRHRHLTSYALSAAELMSADPDEAALVSVPSYHIAGMTAILTNVVSGRRVVYLPVFSAEAWVDLASTEHVSHAMLVPTMLGRVLDVLEKTQITLPKLRSVSYGGGRMPRNVIERALALLPHVSFVNAYGLTETSSTISILTPEDHRRAATSDDPSVRRRLTSVGKALPTIEIQVRDDQGTSLPPGRFGEIYVRGAQVAGEYLEGRAVGADGWFATKDGGWLDEENYLYLDCRLDDIIVRGGENISPAEIEDVLRQHPEIQDVAVIGLPDEQWGEKIVAVIVPRAQAPSADILAAFVRRRLRSTKTPEIWEFRPELPYNDMGKLLRRALRHDLSLQS